MLKNKLKAALIIAALLLPGLSHAWPKHPHRAHQAVHAPKYLKAHASYRRWRS